MHADVPNHEPSLLLMNCGEARLVRPSMGSWLTYGLGTENQNLPGFIAMCPGGYPIQESQNWQAGFLPGVYQGTYIDTQHTDIEKLIENIRNQRICRRDEQRRQLDLLDQLNAAAPGARGSTIRSSKRGSSRSSWPIACRCEAADAFDVSREPQAHPRPVRPGHAGPANPDRPAADRARRAVRAGLARRGPAVGQPRRHRSRTTAGWPASATRRSAPCSADLEAARPARRHAGHLGRRVRPHADGRAAQAGLERGQDQRPRPQPPRLHHVAGRRRRQGRATSTARPTSSASRPSRTAFTSTICTPRCCKLLGFDHEKFTYRYAGRDFRLTDVHGTVVNELIA